MTHNERTSVDYALVDIPFEDIKKRHRPQFTSINSVTVQTERLE